MARGPRRSAASGRITSGGVLARCDPLDSLYSALVEALESLGPPVLEPALAAHAAAESEDQRTAVASVLSGLGVRDDLKKQAQRRNRR